MQQVAGMWLATVIGVVIGYVVRRRRIRWRRH